MARPGIGRQIENEFEADLSCLKAVGHIHDYYKSRWHGTLDYQGVDAIVTRVDKKEIKIDVTTRAGVRNAKRTNRKLKRGNIMVWGHNNPNFSNPQARREKLLEAINNFS